MGKSTAAADFRRLGVPVHDSDACVHALMAKGGAAVDAVAQAFPGVVSRGSVDRQKLGAAVFGDADELRRLEAIIHPLVGARKHAFLAVMARRRVPVVVLDVPLLFETGGEARCDAVVTVTAAAFVQAQRVLQRPAMTSEKFQHILAQQMPDWEKCQRSDFIVQTGLGRLVSLKRIRNILKIVQSWQGTHWPSRPRR